MARRRSRVREIDFTGVKSGGSRLSPEGRYAAKIVDVEEKEGQQSGEPYWGITWEITSKKNNGLEVRFDTYSLQPQSLFRLKGLLEALGQEVPDSKMDVDIDDLLGEECIIEVMDSKQERGIFSRVVGVYPLEDGQTVDDENDAPKDRKETRGGGRRTKDEDEEEEADDRRGPRRARSDKDGVEDEEGDEKDTRRSSGSRKLKKGAEVSFRDEKGKKKKGTVLKIDGDMATVEDDEGELEIETSELTVLD